MALKKREPRVLVVLRCDNCARPGSDGTTPKYFGTTVPLSRAEAETCPNCDSGLTEVGRTMEG